MAGERCSPWLCPMTWFFLALVTALLAALLVTGVKRFFSDLGGFELAAYPLAYSTPLFLVTALFMPTPHLVSGFWQTLFLMLPVNMAGYYCYMRGVTLAPMSLSMPFLSFTPMVVIVTGFLLLDEFPNGWGLLGILAIVGGSYVLNVNKASPLNLLGPFQAVLRERGVLLVLLAAAIFGLAAVLGKKLVLLSEPLYAGVMFFTIHNLVFVLLLAVSGKVPLRRYQLRPWPGMLVGVLMFLEIVFHFHAVSMVDAAYMVSVKRCSGLFAVLFGGIIFKEENIWLRLLGAGLMSLGAAVIVILGT